MADMDEISKPKRPPPLIDSTHQYICLSIPSSIAMIMTYMMEMAAMRYTFPYCFMLGRQTSRRRKENVRKFERLCPKIQRKRTDGRAAFFFFLPLPYFPFHTASSIEVEPHPLVEIRLVTFFFFCGPLPRPPPPKCNVRQQQIVIPNRVTLPYNLPILVGEKGGTSIRRR